MRFVSVLSRWAGLVTLGLQSSTSWCAGQQGSATAARIELPRPTGDFAVGYRKLAIEDVARREPLTPDRTDHRELVLEVWYPAVASADAPTRAYMEAAVATAWSEQHALPEGFQTRIQTHAVADAPAAKTDARWPIIVFSHGLAFPPQNYQASLEDLASHGYSVFAINHTYASTMTVFPDGRQAGWRVWKDDEVRTEEEQLAALARHLPTWVADIRFVVGQLCDEARQPAFLRGQLDASRVGVYGHSFGGIAAVYALHADDRIRAGAALEGKIYDAADRPFTVTRPFLFMLGSYNHRLADEFTADQGHYLEVTVDNAIHVAFGDLLLVYQHFAGERWKRRRSDDTPPDRVAFLMNACLRAFFAEHLRGEDTWLSGTEDQPFPELGIVVR